MKASALILGAIAQGASAHYFFEVANAGAGGESTPFQYIRKPTRETMYNPIKFSSNPPEDIRDDSTVDGEDIICNQGAFTNAGSTEVLTVSAGDEITLKLGVGGTMQHPGPGLVYMSRAPGDDVTAYDGSGEWFKIFEEGVCNEGGDFTTDAWCTWDRDTITATIPKDTPDGEYLVRGEHIGVHGSHENQPEHYVSCVQVKVENGGSGEPGPTVQFPGAYKDTDEYANFSIYNGFKEFPMPGPEVWGGGGGGGGAGGDAGNDGGASAAPSAPAPSSGAGEDGGEDGGDGSAASPTAPPGEGESDAPPAEDGEGDAPPAEDGEGDAPPAEGGEGDAPPAEGGEGDAAPAEEGAPLFNPFARSRGDASGAPPSADFISSGDAECTARRRRRGRGTRGARKAF